ncbi:MAG: Cupredoxin-like domain [Chloroflexota bacterium]|jgi:plastocyanin|nr:Cupredoxin-like domain [Chloroflexota bacterium]
MFRRSALVAAVFLVLASATASAGGNTVHITSSAFPASTFTGIGGDIEFSNESGNSHTSTSDSSLYPWNKPLPPSTSASVNFPFPGAYAYHCNIHSSMHGKIRVFMERTPSSGTTATTFTVFVATAQAPTGFKFIVQRKVPGGQFRAFKSTRAKQFMFHPSAAGTWAFRSRYLRNSDGAMSGWSPVLKIVVGA